LPRAATATASKPRIPGQRRAAFGDLLGLAGVLLVELGGRPLDPTRETIDLAVERRGERGPDVCHERTAWRH
jgi:hypothetical protein